MRSFLLVAVLVTTSLAGCSSDDAATTTPDAASDSDGTPTVPAESCVRPGDKGNDKGIGTPCTPLGKECAAFPGASVCLADLGQKQWMCTRISCANDADCGTDATCYKESNGSGCVPNRCLDAPSDAGTDAPANDAPASDAPATDAPAADSNG